VLRFEAKWNATRGPCSPDTGPSARKAYVRGRWTNTELRKARRKVRREESEETGTQSRLNKPKKEI
jgi:hypothetical protein